MRNYRTITEEEFRELERLYPTTTNRKLSKMFNISSDAIQDRFAYPHGWKKDPSIYAGSRGGKPLGESQVKWIIKHFQHTKNNDILEKFGIGESTLHRIARKYGLKKSKPFLKKIQTEVTEKARQTCEAFGLYEELAERKRAEMQAYKERGEEIPHGFRKGVSSIERLGRKKFEETMRKAQETRRQTVKRERRRLIFGLEQRTKIKLHINGFDERQRRKTSHRYLFKKRGYIVERGGNVMYWDENTSRSTQMEANAPLYGLTIRQYIYDNDEETDYTLQKEEQQQEPDTRI